MFGSSCVPLVQDAGSVDGDRRLRDRMLAAELVGLGARAVRAEGDRAGVGHAGRAVRVGHRGAVDRVLRNRRVERRRRRRHDVGPDGRTWRRQRDRAGAQAPPVVLRQHRTRGVGRRAVEHRVEDAERVVGDVAARDRSIPTAPTSRTPAPRRRFWLFSAWLPSGYGSLFGRRREDASDGSTVAVHEVRRHCGVAHLNGRAGRHADAVLAEERPGRQRQRRRDRRASAGGLAVADDHGRRPGGEVVEVLARVPAGDLVAGQDRDVVDARRGERRRLARYVVASSLRRRERRRSCSGRCACGRSSTSASTASSP